MDLAVKQKSYPLSESFVLLTDEMIIMKRMMWLFITLLLIITACGRTKGHSKAEDIEMGHMPENNSIITLDSSTKSEHLISSQNGGVISIPCGANGRMDIGFIGGAVDQDVVFEVSSINLSTGFCLEEKGLQSNVELKIPASICYVTLDEIPQDTMIVKYDDNGTGYSVIPTQRVQIGDVNGIIAFVDGFSSYGIGSVSKAEMDEMANSLEEAGFDWVLRIDDKIQDKVGAYMTYEVAALIEMRNTEAPNPRVMQGTYRGQAVIRQFQDVTFEGETFYGVTEGKDMEAEFTLHPVFQTFEPEPGSDLPMLCGLVAESYAGKGILKLKKVISEGSNGDNSGINIMDLVDPLANQWGIPVPRSIDMETTFTVTTDGPMAYFTCYIEGVGPVTLTGSIVGYGKKSKEEPKVELEPLKELELEPLVVDKKQNNQEPNPEIEDDYMEDLPPWDDDLRFHENEDGSVDYDIDGDGEPDIRLSPLIIKR